MLVAIVLTINQQRVYAFEYDNEYYDMFDVDDLGNYVNQIEQIQNTKYTGMYYRVGIMGHKRVVELGELKSLKYVVLSAGTNYLNGSLIGLQQIETREYSVTNTTTTSLSIATGFIQILNAAINLESVGSVGGSNQSSVEVEFTYTTTHSTTSITSSQTLVSYNLDKVNPEYNHFKVGQVALIAEFEVKKSYTIEQNIWGNWVKLSNTEKNNYITTSFLDTVSTFIYTDAFGTSDALYYLGVIDLT